MRCCRDFLPQHPAANPPSQRNSHQLYEHRVLCCLHFFSLSYSPALPKTSIIPPRARYFSLGQVSISTTTLSFSLAFFAVTSSTPIGSVNPFPSGSSIHPSGRFTKVPTTLF